MPPYTITNCVATDGPYLAVNNLHAFWEDSAWRLVWRPHQRDYVTDLLKKRFAHNLLMDRAHRRHQKVVDSETGEIMGYCRWLMPDRLSGEWLEAQTPAVSAAQQQEYDETFENTPWPVREDMDAQDDGIKKIKWRITGAKEYMTLDYLAVHPKYQHRGIATMLVKSGIAQAEKLDIDIFVFGFKAGKGLYQSIGFKLLDQLIEDDTKYGGEGEYAVFFFEYVIKREGTQQSVEASTAKDNGTAAESEILQS